MDKTYTSLNDFPHYIQRDFRDPLNSILKKQKRALTLFNKEGNVFL